MVLVRAIVRPRDYPGNFNVLDDGLIFFMEPSQAESATEQALAVSADQKQSAPAFIEAATAQELAGGAGQKQASSPPPPVVALATEQALAAGAGQELSYH